MKSQQFTRQRTYDGVGAILGGVLAEELDALGGTDAELLDDAGGD